jgi:predicted ester cyclase
MPLVTDHKTNVAVAIRHTEAMVTGALNVLDEILHPDWVNHPVQFNEGEGIEGFKRKSLWLYEHFAFHFDHQDVRAFEDFVLIRSLVSGTVRGEFAGVDLTDAPVQFTTLEYHRMYDGRIIESWHLQDYYAMLVQLGAIPNIMNAQIDPYPGWA